jgi:glycosyltransferase involved in cell wall biosynthesis
VKDRVTFIIPSLEAGGIERNVVNLAKGLLARGTHVTLMVARANPEFYRQLPPQVLVDHLHPPRGIWWLTWPLGLVSPRLRLSVATFGPLLRYLRRQKPTAILSFQSHFFTAVALVLLRQRPRFVIREGLSLSADMASKGAAGRVIVLVKRWTYRRAYRVVANSYGSVADLQRTLGLGPERVAVVYNPTNEGRIIDESRAPLDHSWFSQGEPPVVLGVGRLTAQKDFATLIRAFAIVRQQIPARLVILGEGPERAMLEQLVLDLGLAQDVDMPGFMESPYPFMARASVFVLSSLYEGLPNVLIEALAIGTPSVSTDCPSGPQEILEGGKYGPLVTMGDHEAVAQAVAELLMDRAKAQAFVDASRASLLRFTPEAVLDAWVEVLDLAEPDES